MKYLLYILAIDAIMMLAVFAITAIRAIIADNISVAILAGMGCLIATMLFEYSKAELKSIE